MLPRSSAAEDGMLGKSPTLAKTARMGHPTSKAQLQRQRGTAAQLMALTVLDTIPKIYEWAILPGLRVEC
jgi:hypothetical protein